MAQQDVQKFAALLTEAIHQIKQREQKPIRVIQDEIGYEMGRSGGSMIESWRKGAHMPQRIRDVEQLATILVTRGKLPVGWFDQYVQANGYDAELAALRNRLFPSEKPRSALEQSSPFQAPALVPHLVGQRREITQVCAELQQMQSPHIVALVGMGGVGKTTLAAYIAHTLRKIFNDGILWAFAATNAPLDIIEQWAKGYGYDLSSLHDLQNRAAALRGLLAGKKVLLIVDDVIHANDIRPLLPGGEGCAVLLTTRNEDVAVALSATVIHLDELSMTDSLELLVAILGNERLFAEHDAAHQICRQLQYLPLALEIVGQLLKARPSQRLARMATHLEVLDHRLDLQISDRAVRTSFRASWETLDDLHRTAFTCLGVFAGRAFSVEAFAFVAELDLDTAQDRLYTLKALSLIRETALDRFQQHPLLAGFASEQLGAAPVRHVRMAQYYEHFVAKHWDQDTQLEGEGENITATLHVASHLQAWPLVLALGQTLTGYWFRQARFAQARQGYQLMYAAAIAMDDQQSQAFALHRWGWACLEQDDYDEATQHLEESLRLFALYGDDAGRAEAHFGLARMALEQAQYADAHRHVAEYRQLCERRQDFVGLARAYYQQGYLAYHVGDLELAHTLDQKAYAIQISQKDSPDILPTIRLLVDVAIEQQEFEAAERYCRQALEIAQRLQNRGEAAATYYSMVVVARMQNRLALAIDYSNIAQELFEKMGDQGFLALILYEQSRIHSLLGEPLLAQRAAEHSANLFRQLENKFNLVYALNHLGKVQKELGYDDKAAAAWQEAIAIAGPLAHPLLGQLRQQLSDLDR